MISEQCLYVWIRPRVLAQLMLPIQTAEVVKGKQIKSTILNYAIQFSEVEKIK